MASILLVVDEADVLTSIRTDLDVSGFQSRMAPTGAEALELVAQRHFDAAIIATTLPDTDGVALIDRFKALRPRMACILLAPEPSRETSLRALAAGALAYVVAPMPAEQITHIIQERRRHGLAAVPSALAVPVTAFEERPVLRPAGDLDVVTAPLLQQRLDELMLGGHRHILIDASALTFCDSSGLRCLVATQRRLRARDGDLALLRVGGLLLRLLELSHTASFFRCYPSEEAALADLAATPSG